MKLTLVISSLSCGGAERVLSTMANCWAEAGREVTLVTLDSAAEDFYELHPEIERVALGLMAKSTRPWEAVGNNLRRLAHLRRAIRASPPDAVVSFIDRTNILVLLAALGMRVPVVVSERIDATQQPPGRAWSVLRRVLYPMASAVVLQTEVMRRWAGEFIRENRTHVVPNLVQPAPVVQERAENSSSACSVVAMGRLTPQKGFDLLLRAFARCAVDHPDWSITILGEGTERYRLETLAEELGICDQLHMPGQIREPQEVLLSADFFVLSSRYEGFPNALLEAMASGLPVVSFDCPSGPRDIVRDGVDGSLVEDGNVDALAATMKRLMSDAAERARMSARSVEVTERFGLEKVMGMWEDVVDTVVKRSRS